MSCGPWWILLWWSIRSKDLLSLVSRLWWVFLLCPVILYVISDCNGYYQVLQVMTRDLLSLCSRPWWIFPLCPMILYVVLNCDTYCLIYLTLCYYVSLTSIHEVLTKTMRKKISTLADNDPLPRLFNIFLYAILHFIWVIELDLNCKLKFIVDLIIACIVITFQSWDLLFLRFVHRSYVELIKEAPGYCGWF